MDCTWWGPGYGAGWYWTGPIFWLLLLAAIVFLIFLALRNSRQNGSGNAGAGSFHRPMAQSQCPKCGAPVEQAYLCCPECHYRLKVNCPSCGKLVKTSWELCPYCEAPITESSQALVNH